jgi:erythromycin esterase
MPVRPRALLAACAVLAACESPAESRPVPETPLEWVEQNAQVVRSSSVTDRDYGDLRALRSAIGDARVVMLGEQTHGDGATFLAKARLIAFLHREMDFDVLAWESGLYDMDAAWRRILAGQDVEAVTRDGVYGIWGVSEQVGPTLTYVASTLNTTRPLEMAGFDPFLTGSLGDSLSAQVSQLARQIGSPVVNDPAWPSLLETLHDIGIGRGGLDEPPAEEQETLLRLMGTLGSHASAAGGRRNLWWAQALESLGAFARIVWAQPAGGGNTPEMDIIREDQMSRNLLWLADEHYRDRKIIVWAHNTHIARNHPVLRSLGGVQQGTAGLRRMGEQVHAALGDDVYALGFTAARGSWASGTTPVPLQPPVEGSLEAHLDQLGMAYAFVDFRDPGPGGEWLQDAVARPFNYVSLRGDWPRVLDGMFYTREMTPSTRLPQ